jgi:hypothetical protein
MGGVHQHDADDITRVLRREEPREPASVRVPDQDVWTLDPRVLEKSLEVTDLGLRRSRPRTFGCRAPAETRAVIAARPRRARDRRLDVPPVPRIAAEAGFEDDRRAAVTDALVVEEMPADVHGAARASGHVERLRPVLAAAACGGDHRERDQPSGGNSSGPRNSTSCSSTTPNSS